MNEKKTGTGIADAALVLVRNGERSAGAWAFNDPCQYPEGGQGVTSDGFLCGAMAPGQAMGALLINAAAHVKKAGASAMTAWCYGLDQDAKDIAGNYKINGVQVTAITGMGPDHRCPQDPNYIRYQIARGLAQSMLGACQDRSLDPAPEFDPEAIKPGEHVIYANGPRLEIGLVKSVNPDKGTAFVWYTGGDTAASTPLDCLYPIVNRRFIQSKLGGMDAAAILYRERKNI